MSSQQDPLNKRKRALSLTEGSLLFERAKKKQKKATEFCLKEWTLIKQRDAKPWTHDEDLEANTGPLITGVPRNASMLGAFLAIMTTPLLYSLRKALGPSFNIKTYFKIMALRIYIQFTEHPPIRGVETRPLYNAFLRASSDFSAKFPKVPCWSTWSKHFNNWAFPIAWCRTHLSSAFGSLVRGVPFYVLDEKLKRYTGNSPYIRQVLTKPDKIGHWISELCVLLAQDIPFCTGVYPLTSCKAAGEKTSVLTLIEWAARKMHRLPAGKNPTLVADSYYLDTAGKKHLNDTKIPYICSVNPVRFRSQCDVLKREVGGSHGKWAAIQNSGTGELAVHVMDPTVGAKYVFTNCFKEQTRKKLRAHQIPVWGEYRYAFSACDKLNLQMAGHYWPFRRMTWSHSIDSFVFTVLLFNTYNLYRFANDEDTSIIGTKDAMIDLSFSLYAHAEAMH